jgi:ABC-type antimicrobial peptide transport system permease subunit
MVAPSFGDVVPGRLDEGATMPLSDLRRLDPQAVVRVLIVRYAPGVSPAAGFASLQRGFGSDILTYEPALDVANLERIRTLPFLLAALLVVLGLATTAHALVTSVRARRRDLAVLKTIGFRRGQVAATVAWQSITFAAIALVVGLPLGVLAGSWAWRAVADQIGSVSPVAVPLGALALLAPIVLAIAVSLAAVPGWWATRVSPATALRTE